jgi:hypothetical protein
LFRRRPFPAATFLTHRCSIGRTRFLSLLKLRGWNPPLDPTPRHEPRGARRPRLRCALHTFYSALHRFIPLRARYAVGCCSSMETIPNFLPCDGCGLPASPEHIAERVRRLELSTRFRPVHIGVLFVMLAPPARSEDDFYAPSASQNLFDPLFDALQIHASATHATSAPGANGAENRAENGDGLAKLSEFQRRGHFLAYLSECPIPAGVETAAATVARLGPTLVRRIRFNYRPKHIAPIGQELLPLTDILNKADISNLLTQSDGQLLPDPRTGGRTALELFQKAVVGVVPRDYPSPGYDRIQVTHPE